jgi:hypothetical protein
MKSVADADGPDPVHHATAGDFLIEAIADAVARKLERMAGMQQRLMDVEAAARYPG